jgi:hypothetical protein
MKAITLHQPWASLIAIGAKPFETRSWPPPRWLIGQRIAIHAGKKGWRDAIDEPMLRAFASAGYQYENMPLGAVVCTARLAGAYRLSREIGGHAGIAEMLPKSARLANVRADDFGDYSPGRWAWMLDEIAARLPPDPARGAQGFWDWSGEAQAA